MGNARTQKKTSQTPPLAHIGISGCGFQLLSLPKNQSADPTPVPAKPQKSVIFSHHNPLVTEFRTPAFLKNGRVWVFSTSTHRSRSPGTQLPTTWILLCGLVLPHWGLGPPRPSFPHSLVPPCLACCLQASWGTLPSLHSQIQIRGSQLQAQLWLRPQDCPRAPPLSFSALGSCSQSQKAALGGP